MIDKIIKEFEENCQHLFDDQFPEGNKRAETVFAGIMLLARDKFRGYNVELEIADKRWESNEKYKEEYMDMVQEYELKIEQLTK